MKTLLRIDSSVRTDGSYSRLMADYYESLWTSKHPEHRVIRRDLAAETIPHLTGEVADAFFSYNQNHVLELSNVLIDELFECTTLLISCPLYNFTIPSTLKSYLDHVVRVNKTVNSLATGGYEGLLKNKEAVIITSKGDVYSGVETKYQDFSESYLKTILNFIGFEHVKAFSAEGTANKNYIDREVPVLQSEMVNFINS